MTSNVYKEVFQKHGLTEPCPICKDNHVPAATWRDAEKRCRANIRDVCVCCKACADVCDGQNKLAVEEAP